MLDASCDRGPLRLCFVLLAVRCTEYNVAVIGRDFVGEHGLRGYTFAMNTLQLINDFMNEAFEGNPFFHHADYKSDIVAICKSRLQFFLCENESEQWWTAYRDALWRTNMVGTQDNDLATKPK